jgi:hypothetical protein
MQTKDNIMNPYKSLAKTISIHFVIMYALSYLLINSVTDAYLFSTRPLYMALAMVAPMVFLMVYFMRDMMKDKQLNQKLLVGSVVVFMLAIWGARAQFGVGNELFLKSMIPHHSGAITVCQEANITDPEIEGLCDDIIKAQQQEIKQMKQILERLTA